MTLNVRTLAPQENYIAERAASFLSTRVFSTEDAVGVARLNELADEEHFISFDGATRFIMCTKDDRLVGFTTVIDSETVAGPIARIPNIVVDPTEQGSGVCKEILGKVTATSNTIACETINPILVQAFIKATATHAEQTGERLVTIWGDTVFSTSILTEEETQAVEEKAKAIREELYELIKAERLGMGISTEMGKEAFVNEGLVPVPEGLNVEASQQASAIPEEIQKELDKIHKFGEVQGKEYYGVLLAIKV